MNAVLIQDQGPVRVVTLNRPHRLNAVDMAMLEGLDAALAGAEEDPGVRAILLEGAGRAFCAGDDFDAQVAISGAGRGAVELQVATLQRISARMLFGTKPVVAAVQGWAVGGGFAWTLGCDFTLWAEDATGFLPEIGMGLFVSGGASWLLPRLAGPMVAREMLHLGRRMTASELHAAGLASRITLAGRCREEALGLAAQLAALPPAAVARAKRALIEPERAALEAAMALEAEACIAGAMDPTTLDRLRAMRRA